MDIAKIGMTWENLSFGAGQPDSLPMYAHLIMLAVDTVLYFLLAVYLDAVIPGKSLIISHFPVTQQLF